jgi:hypothetical protein
MNIYETPFQNKDLDWRFQHFRKLAATGIDIAVILSPDCALYMQNIVIQYPNVRVIRYMNLSETWVYQTYHSVLSEGVEIGLPNSRNEQKDTKEYILLMNAKTEFLKIAVETNPFGSSHYAWIDFNIYHIFTGREQRVLELLHGLSRRTMAPYFLTLPGCWGKEHVNESFLLNDICWRFCGGFFIGSADRMLEFDAYYTRFFETFLREKQKLVWEVNFWAYVELAHSMSVIWYPGDHNEKILEISVRNMALSLSSLPSTKVVKYDYPDHGEYIPTSTGYAFYKGEHIINTRYVNYWLYPNGAYWIKDPQDYIRTRNFCSRLDSVTLEPVAMTDSADAERFSTDKTVTDSAKAERFSTDKAEAFKEMVVDPRLLCHGGRIYGLEDIRLYENATGELCFIATSINYSGTGSNRMIRGLYDIDLGVCSRCEVLVPPDPNSWCEKNWIPILHKGQDKFIYKWSPLEVGTIRDMENGTKQLIIESSWVHTAPMFSNIRGSTPLVETAEGFVGVVHFSYEGGPRNYFHALVLLEKETLVPLRYSEFFYFHEITVEFSIGFMIQDERYHFWLSNFDRDPEMMSVRIDELPLQFEFFYNIG